MPTKFAEAELSPYFLNNHKEILFWTALVLFISLSCFFILRFIKKPKGSKLKHQIYQVILYSGNTFCWGLLYYFVIDQFLEGLLYSWMCIIYFPIYSRYGILSLMASIVYVLFFGLFYLNIYLMITVCTKVEIKFELEVEKKKATTSN